MRVKILPIQILLAMRIECKGTISIVLTESKPYWHKRKGYYRGDKWIKPKKTLKYKQVPIKNPCLGGDIELKVYEKLVIGGWYVCDNHRLYFCHQVTSIPEAASYLRVRDTNLGKCFTIPKDLLLVSSGYREGEPSLPNGSIKIE